MNWSLLKKLIYLFAFLIAFYIGSLTAVFCLPRESITNNVITSMDDVIVKEAAGYRVKRNSEYLGPGPVSFVDALTDGVMLTRNINYNIVEENRVSAFQHFFGFSTHFPDKIYSNPLKEAMNMNGYGRYWHGYEIILRPLLIFFDYGDLRIINIGVLFLLVCYSAHIVYHRCGLFSCSNYILALLLCKLPLIPQSLQFMNMTVLMIIGIIVLDKFVLVEEHKNIKNIKFNNLLLLSFVMGSLTAFFDLLTTPILPMGLCLLIVFANLKKHNIFDIKVSMVVKIWLLWGLGYLSTWMMKWCICSFVLEQNMIYEAYNQVVLRIFDVVPLSTGETIESSTTLAILLNLALIVEPFNYLFTFIICVIFALIMIFFRSKFPNEKVDYGYIKVLLLMAVLPIIWYGIVKNHSQIHYWYTYRSLMITILAIGMYCEHVVAWNRSCNWLRERFEIWQK